ncbi:MAG TPA: hypothetical protein VKE94_05425, partial [Gemmataceae bacterium]|nr:hypothetical protein [Gemmataceae bacterium]
MKRSHLLGLAAFALVMATACPALAGPADAADAPLAQVPAKAPIVVHLRGFEQTKDRLIAMIKNALPDLGGMAEEKINGLVKQGLEGRSLKGLAKNGPMFVVFIDLPKSGDEDDFKKNVAGLVRVTKYAEFRDGFLNDEERKALKKEGDCEVTQVHGEDVYFVDRGEFAVVAHSKEAAQALAKKPAQGLDGKLAKDLAAQLLESDLSAYVDVAAVRAQFHDQIADAKDKIEKALGDAEGAAGLQKSQLEMMKRMIGPVFQAIDDSQAFVLAFDLRKQGLALHAQASVGANSKTNKLLQGKQPTAFDELGRLPAGLMSYSAMQIHADWMADLGGYLFGASSPDKENKNLKAALDDLAAAKPRVQLNASGIPLKGLQVWTYDDPAKAVAAQVKMVRALEAGDVFQVAPVKDLKVKEKAEKHGGFELHSFSATWDFEKMMDQFTGAPGVPDEFKKKFPAIMKKWMGEDIHVWFGTDGKTVVQVIAKNFKEAQALLDQYTQGKKTIGEQQAYKD